MLALRFQTAEMAMQLIHFFVGAAELVILLRRLDYALDDLDALEGLPMIHVRMCSQWLMQIHFLYIKKVSKNCSNYHKLWL